MKFRVNSITGKKEIRLQPKGLPPIWVPYGTENLCQRCKSFNVCLKFNEISSDRWNQLDMLIEDINNYPGEMIDICIKENKKLQ